MIKTQLNWYGHLTRMDPKRIASKEGDGKTKINREKLDGKNRRRWYKQRKNYKRNEDLSPGPIKMDEVNKANRKYRTQSDFRKNNSIAKKKILLQKFVDVSI